MKIHEGHLSTCTGSSEEVDEYLIVEQRIPLGPYKKDKVMLRFINVITNHLKGS